MKVKYDEIIPWWHMFFGCRPTVHEVEMTFTKNTINYKLDGEKVKKLMPESNGIRFVTETRNPLLRVTAMEIMNTLFPSEKKSQIVIDVGNGKTMRVTPDYQNN